MSYSPGQTQELSFTVPWDSAGMTNAKDAVKLRRSSKQSEVFVVDLTIYLLRIDFIFCIFCY